MVVHTRAAWSRGARWVAAHRRAAVSRVMHRVAAHRKTASSHCRACYTVAAPTAVVRPRYHTSPRRRSASKRATAAAARPGGPPAAASVGRAPARGTSWSQGACWEVAHMTTASTLTSAPSVAALQQVVHRSASPPALCAMASPELPVARRKAAARRSALPAAGRGRSHLSTRVACTTAGGLQAVNALGAMSSSLIVGACRSPTMC